jgi:hypothetical protein
MLVNYERAALGQAKTGHISPIAAYNAKADRLLVLDVATYKYPPVWVVVVRRTRRRASRPFARAPRLLEHALWLAPSHLSCTQLPSGPICEGRSQLAIWSSGKQHVQAARAVQRALQGRCAVERRVRDLRAAAGPCAVIGRGANEQANPLVLREQRLRYGLAGLASDA